MIRKLFVAGIFGLAVFGSAFLAGQEAFTAVGDGAALTFYCNPKEGDDYNNQIPEPCKRSMENTDSYSTWFYTGEVGARVSSSFRHDANGNQFHGDHAPPTFSTESNGWTFTGWYTNDDCSGDVVTGDSIVKTINNNKYYACWQKTERVEKVKITFDANGGTVEGQPSVTKEISKGAKILGQVPDPVRNGYVFWGWSRFQDVFKQAGMMSDEGKRACIEEKKCAININTTADGDETFYAQWESANTICNVAVNPNGGLFYIESPTDDGFRPYGGTVKNAKMERTFQMHCDDSIETALAGKQIVGVVNFDGIDEDDELKLFEKIGEVTATFTGWYEDPAAEVELSAITDGMTVYAGWQFDDSETDLEECINSVGSLGYFVCKATRLVLDLFDGLIGNITKSMEWRLW